MAPVRFLIVLIQVLQIIHGYNFQQRGRSLDIDGSGMTELEMDDMIEDMSVEKEDEVHSFFQEVLDFILPIKVNKLVFDENSPIQYLIQYDYSELIESIQTIMEFIRSEDSPGHYLAQFDWGSLIGRLTLGDVKAVPRSLFGGVSNLPATSFNFVRDGLKNIAEVGIVDSVKNFAVMIKDQARSLTSELTTTSILLYSTGVIFIGGLFVIAIPVTAILGVIFYGVLAVFLKMGRNLVDSFSERDDYLMDGISTATRALGARGFDEEVLDRMASRVMQAVDTYTLLQSLKDGFSK